jgi:hypothetical protein
MRHFGPVGVTVLLFLCELSQKLLVLDDLIDTGL